MNVQRAHGWRVIATVVVTSAVVLAAAGCGGGSDSPKSTAQGSASGTPAKPATLVVWDYANDCCGGVPKQQQAYRDMIAAVNKKFEAANPGVKIKQRHLGYGDYAVKLPAAVASNTAPDVAWDYTDTFWKYTQPLNDLLTPEQKKNLTLLDQTVVAAKDRKLHTMPFGVYEGVWMYNKALFAKYGIKPPTTQSELLAACDTLNKAGVVPIRATFGGQYTMNRYAALLAGQLIPDISSWNKQDIAYTSPQFRQGVQAFMDMTKHKCWGPNPESKGVAGEGDQMFRAGKTAIQYVLSGPNVADYEKTIGKGNLGVFLQPALPGGKPSMDASLNNGFDILKTTDQKDLAWKYISFWEEPAQHELAWRTEKWLPTNKTANITTPDPVYKQMLAWARDPQFHVGAWPVTPQEFKVWDDLTPEVITGRTSVDDLLSQLQTARDQSKG